MTLPAAPQHDTAFMRRFDCNGPRYTSYPTADRFSEAFGPDEYRKAVARRRGGARRPLALYLHLPFCGDVCYYCACNKVVTRNPAKVEEYLLCLKREITLQGALFRDDPCVVQMHWGGGTPTYHDAATLRGLLSSIKESFGLDPRGEYSIEVDPRTVEAATMAELRSMGFNRVSFGVQDFDPAVQAAIHRFQGKESALEAIAAARRAGFDSINVDLVYGLPKQTPASFERTLARVVAALPARIAIYNYAHLPTVFKAQRRIREADLPAPQTKLELLALAVSRLTAAGYVQIGMDHFALPGDALAVAQRQGTLRRGFQGYTAGPDCDLVGLGVSAIGAIGATYSQNCRDLRDYCRVVDAGRLPIMRGLELSVDDLARRAVIQKLMCQFALSKTAIETAYLLTFDRYFARELEALREYEDSGMVTWDGDWLTVTPGGRPAIRAICMVFDRYLQTANGAQFSRVI